MVLSQRLDLRQSQTLVMTPQLQQAIKLLQMSSQDLTAFVAEEIENNPLLEKDEDRGDRLVAEIANAEVAITESIAAQVSMNDTKKHDEEQALSGSDLRIEESSHEDNDYGSDDAYRHEGSGGGSGGDDGEYSAVQNVAVGDSLRDHLLSQIHVDFVDPADRLIATALVELLDDAGYLTADLEAFREQIGATSEQLERVIARAQKMDPPGIFARSLTECLAAQLREKNRLDPAMEALLAHLELLAKRDRAALMKICGVDAEDLDEMIAEIRALDPKPATAFTVDVAPPITPDVFLRTLQGGGWRIELNSDNLPRVLANEKYYAEVQGATRQKAEKDYISERWQQATWLVKALHQRATTILKVAAEIVRMQEKFFVHGVQFLRPLVLRDIAEAVEMHESTISRVTQNKYIATPRGIYELKYFFSNAIGTTGGTETVAAVAVRDRIKSLIEEEKPDAILSDDKIVDLLRREGIDLARRTVAKYRDVLHIPSSSQRRREKKDKSR